MERESDSQQELAPKQVLAHEAPKTQGPRRLEHEFTAGQSQSEVFCMQYDPSDSYIATGYGDGHVRIFNTTSGLLSFEIDANIPGGSGENATHEKPITRLRWKPQGASKTLSILTTISSDGYI